MYIGETVLEFTNLVFELYNQMISEKYLMKILV